MNDLEISEEKQKELLPLIWAVLQSFLTSNALIEWIETYVFKFEYFKVITGEKELKIIKEMIYQMME